MHVLLCVYRDMAQLYLCGHVSFIEELWSTSRAEATSSCMFLFVHWGVAKLHLCGHDSFIEELVSTSRGEAASCCIRLVACYLCRDMTYSHVYGLVSCVGT